MKVLSGNPRTRAPRRGARRAPRAEGRYEPATFAWTEPLADVDPVVVERETQVDRMVDRQVFVDRPVEVERIVEIEKPVFVDRTVEVEKIVEKFVDREVIVEKPVYVDRTVEVEKIVEIEKPVEKIVEKPIIVEKEVFRDKPVKADAATGVAAGVAAVAAAEVVKNKRFAKKDKAPKAIIVGRGPTMASKLGRIMPKPLPVLAGATSLLAVFVALALVSPSSDNASAEHGKVSVRTAAAASTPSLKLSNSQPKLRGQGRDPFAAKGYKAPTPTAATSATDPKTVAAQKQAAKTAAATRAAAPAATPASLYTANVTTYSSYTPWTKARKRAGGWLDFDQKPTVKVLSVGKGSIQLFVVTDVEVIKDKSAHISYNKPVRQVKMAKGGVVRFADYRNIQGDDVTYTIRYDGSDRIKVARN